MTQILRWDPKDPQEVLDYRVDWSDRLEVGDVIVDSTWVRSGPDTALVLGVNSHDDSSTLLWLSAGTLGAEYRLTNHVTTQQGREMDATVRLKIREK